MNRSGFSLVELSIVLVIIGLAIAAFLVSQEYIAQYRLKKVISDWQEYDNAVAAFKMQHLALPGDITNASSYYPSCTDNATNLCDGNGDGIINMNTGREGVRAWEHLSYAGLIHGQFNGGLYTTIAMDPGINTPKSPIRDGCYFFNITASAWTSESPSTDSIIISGAARSNTGCTKGLFKPHEAMYLENKIDDGVRDTGIILGQDGIGTGFNVCVTGTAYDIDEDVAGCRLGYRFASQ